MINQYPYIERMTRLFDENTEILYKVTNYYSQKHDLGIAWNDPTLKINWRVSVEEVKIPEKDKNQPNFDLLGDYF